jgi:hypothetical protein
MMANRPTKLKVVSLTGLERRMEPFGSLGRPGPASQRSRNSLPTMTPPERCSKNGPAQRSWQSRRITSGVRERQRKNSHAGLFQTLLYEIFRLHPELIPRVCSSRWADMNEVSNGKR